MWSMLRPWFLNTAILAALLRAKEPRLRVYLWAELVSSVLIDLALWHFGWTKSYTWAYFALRPVELAGMLYLARPEFMGAFFALGCGWLAFLGRDAPETLVSVFLLAEGALYALAGV